MTQEKRLIESTLVDQFQKLKLPSLFGLFQDIATADAEKIGFGHENTTDAGKLWVFTRVYCEIEEYPTYLSVSDFLTYPNERKAFAFPRQLKVTSQFGKTQAKISSIWALIDKDSRKLIFKPDLPEAEGHHEKDELPLPGKVETKPCSFAYERKIRHSDIDINGHLNNTRYIEMIVDIHDAGFYKRKEIASLLINFETESSEGETIEIYVSDDGTYVSGRCDDRICFEANLTYR